MRTEILTEDGREATAALPPQRVAFPAMVPDLEAWCRATGHGLVDVQRNGKSYRLTLRKGAPRPNDHEAAVVVSPAEKLRQLQALGGVLYACGPSLQHSRVDPDRLAFGGVVVCEYLTFMEVMQQADVQLYA